MILSKHFSNMKFREVTQISLSHNIYDISQNNTNSNNRQK